MKVKELLADPKSWTQRELARDSWGREVDIQDEGAICWCIAGGITKCYPDPEEFKSARNKILRVIDPENKNRDCWWKTIYNFNDSATHEEVMKVLEQADV